MRHTIPGPRPARAAPLRDFAAVQSGAVAVFFVILLPALLLAGALAIDLMNINSERRYVQAQADLAALSAAGAIATADGARAAARATVAANAAFPACPLADADIEFGTAPAPGRFDAAADQDSTAGATAVRVAVTAPAHLFLLDLFLSAEGLVVRREAVAAVAPPRVSFALSNCLAELALLNGLLRPLIGAEVDVLCSGRGIDTRIDLFETLGDIALAAHLLTPSGDPVTYGDLLDAELPVSDILSVLTGAPVPPMPGTVRLGEALVLADDLRHLTVDTPVHALQAQAADLILLTAELMGRQVADLETRVDLGPFAHLRGRVRVGEPRRMVVDVVPGSPEAWAETAQIRVAFDDVNILGLFTLQLTLRLATASATLTDEGDTCAREPDAVVAVFDPVDASLIDLDLTTRAIGLPLGAAALVTDVDTARDRETRRVAFTRAQFDAGEVARFGPVGDQPAAEAVAEIRDTLARMLGRRGAAVAEAAATPTCAGLLGCASGALAALQGALNGVAGGLLAASVNIANGLGAEGTMTNALLDDLIGLQLARADLALLALECGSDRPRLVR